MSFQRDLAWKYLNSLYGASISYQFARYALALNYDVLPQEVVHEAKRILLDGLANAIGAYDAPGRPMCEAVVRQLGGSPEATVIGSGFRTTALNATLVNSFMERFLDYNDWGGGGHNTDSLPPILAVAEREKSDGKSLLTAIVSSYELGSRFAEGSRGTGSGFVEVRGNLSMPPTLGKLMGMDEEQIANAIGLCGSYALPLGILDTNKEENLMGKNLRFGMVAYNALLACMLAKQGVTGPVRIIEGENGLGQVVFHGKLDLQKMLDFSGWRVLDTKHKPISFNMASISHIMATIALVNENSLKPDDISSVRIKTNIHDAEHTTALSKKYPRNAETADHSSFFANAIAIKEGKLDPDSFEPQKFTDPIVLSLIERITVEADATLSNFGGSSEITTRDGRVFKKRIDVFHGFGNDPLSDKEIEEKFKALSEKHLKSSQINKLISMVWSIDSLDDTGKLMKLMVITK